ncbi:hypothetical protein [Pontiella sp.]|uniref:hypothetical protein n=1 Tax=Pontiella sp. TaxID=2837462 RepID=UPI00356B090E
MKWLGLVVCCVAPVVWSDSALVDFDLGLVYPAVLGGMECEQVEKYEARELGYTLYYKRGEDFGLELSVFDLGRPSIETGHAVDGIAELMQIVEHDHERQQKVGAISNIRKRGATVVPKDGAVQFANTVYGFLQPREVDGGSKNVPRIESVYVTAAHHRFFKVRFTFDVANGKDARLMAEQFVEQLAAAIKGGRTEEELLLAACDVLVRDPASYAGRSAAQRISEKVLTMGNLNIYPHLFAWPDGFDKPAAADLLVMAYMSGMLKVVIPRQLASGGEAEGFAAMLAAYESLRKRDQIEALPKLDAWLKAPDKKALFQELLYQPVEE